MTPLPGDIIGFLGNSDISRLICVGTGGWPFWPYLGLSHLGIVGEYNGETLLFESTTLCDLPCRITGQTIKGTQAHPIQDRVDTYDGHVWHYPLAEPLWPHERERLNDYLLTHLGSPYDRLCALFAADIFPSFIESWLHPEYRDRFCSFWTAAAHVNIGRFKTSDLGRWSPTRFTRIERTQGILLPPIKLCTNSSKICI